MTHERGFALITVLWLVAVLSAAVGVGIASTRIGQRTTLNRVALTRGRWAAEGCLEIAAARWKAKALAGSGTVDLGQGTRCRWQVMNPGSRINVNTADREMLSAVGLDSQQISRIVAGRPFYAVSQAQLPETLFTVDGDGTIDLNAAPPSVLAALPGMTDEAVATRRPLRSLDELAGLLSAAGRSALLGRYDYLSRLVTFAPRQLVVTSQGWVVGQTPVATIEVVTVPLPDRLAIIRRRMW